jgi:prepilin-type N-terminal cleavage/methylation domain-containing protein
MRKILSGKGGFTLVELLVVMGIMGVVIGSIYSLYLTHMRNAYTQDEVVEVQQNLRIAMDAISTDLKKAGALVPYGTAPVVDPGTATATTLTINTAEPTGAVTRINRNKMSSAFANFSTTVDSADTLDQFTAGDAVRVIRPFRGTQPFYEAALSNYTTLVVESVSSAKSSIYLNRADFSTFHAGIEIKNGDIVSKKMGSAQPRFDNVTYSVGNCPVGSGLSESCLLRSVNGGSGDVVASNLAGILFSFRTSSAYGSSVIEAVQVTIDGVTRKKASSTDALKSRQLTSIVKLRNRRDF